MASPVAYVTIKGNGGTLWAGTGMNSGTAGVKGLYANFVQLENIIVGGFYDNIYCDNCEYTDLDRVFSNGGTDSNLWYQQSDVSHGPYWDGPLRIRGGTYDSATGPYSIHVTDWAVWDMDEVDVVGGGSNTIGIYGNSSNGIPSGGNPSYAQSLHFNKVTVDSWGSYGVYIANASAGSISNSWFSAGRVRGVPCMALQSVFNFTINANQLLLVRKRWAVDRKRGQLHLYSEHDYRQFCNHISG